MKLITLLFVAMTIGYTVPGFAVSSDGPGSSGGGDVIVSLFVHTANVLLETGYWDYRDKELLSSTLLHSQIRSVKVLMDDKTGFRTPVKDQSSMVAYSSPGVIQIKDDPESKSLESLIVTGEPINQYVIHELFRASGKVDEQGRSVDDVFQLSINKYHLDRQDGGGFIEDYYACSIEGSTRKHVLKTSMIETAQVMSAARLTRSNEKAGALKMSPISPKAVHCMSLKGFLNLEKFKQSLGPDLFVD